MKKISQVKVGFFGPLLFLLINLPLSLWSNGTLSLELETDLFCINENLACEAEIEFAVYFADTCVVGSTSLEISINGEVEVAFPSFMEDTLDFTLNAFRTPGDYIIEAKIKDSAENEWIATASFMVKDCQAPRPICQEGVFVELEPQLGGGASLEIPVINLIGLDIGDCSGQGEEEIETNNGQLLPIISQDAYSVHFEDSIVANPDWQYISPYEDNSVRSLSIDCDYLEESNVKLVVLRVYAEDSTGNYDYCTSFVRLSDFTGVCNPANRNGIGGSITTENQKEVAGVDIKLSGSANLSSRTGTDGRYNFVGIAPGGDYTVVPSLDAKPNNGISTFDLILISGHIIGSRPLDSPYKIIAADINNSKTVSTLDLIKLRKLILNIDLELEENNSWRFVDADYVFPDPSNPWLSPFPERKNFNNLVGDNTAFFVAVKIGDVNGTANLEARSQKGTLQLKTREQKLQKGQLSKVDFYADLSTIAGYQFTLSLEKAEILKIIEGAAKSEHFGFFPEKGIITSSFNGKAKGRLFSLLLRPQEDTYLSKILNLNSRYTQAEAYSINDQQLNVELSFEAHNFIPQQGLQNYPNPFKQQTFIDIHTTKKETAQLFIFDIKGQLINTKALELRKGKNHITLAESLFPDSGLFFYSIIGESINGRGKLLLQD